MQLADAIDRLLPQTQCTRCGYDACAPYAAAIAANEADINRCPPGGSATIVALAALTGRAIVPLDPACGVEAPPTVARIDEARCIGCAKCLPPCPVDAIIGAPRHMHTVLTELCTGCELCVAPCPVDCIAIVPRASVADSRSTEPTTAANRERFIQRSLRIERRAAERAQLLAAKKRAAHST
ncbi:MAG: RnfABCDGE type electron transport complex subunit B [Pseudomonadales bacterium]|nr:RnfABCDGE type electron transport complex subunit B [Pseudomonadales bacterium]